MRNDFLGIFHNYNQDWVRVLCENPFSLWLGYPKENGFKAPIEGSPFPTIDEFCESLETIHLEELESLSLGISPQEYKDQSFHMNQVLSTLGKLSYRLKKLRTLAIGHYKNAFVFEHLPKGGLTFDESIKKSLDVPYNYDNARFDLNLLQPLFPQLITLRVQGSSIKWPAPIKADFSSLKHLAIYDLSKLQEQTIHSLAKADYPQLELLWLRSSKSVDYSPLCSLQAPKLCDVSFIGYHQGSSLTENLVKLPLVNHLERLKIIDGDLEDANAAQLLTVNCELDLRFNYLTKEFCKQIEEISLSTRKVIVDSCRKDIERIVEGFFPEKDRLLVTKESIAIPLMAANLIRNTPLFTKGQKVYVYNVYWGMNEQALVVGRYRRKRNWIKGVCPIHILEHFRPKVEHAPILISLLEDENIPKLIFHRFNHLLR